MVLSRDQLLDLTRGRAADVFDRSVDNQVSRLRRKIERDPRKPALIKTALGRRLQLRGRRRAHMRRVQRLLRALWPRRLAGQLIALLLLALVVSQAVSLVILLDERRLALRAAERAQVLARTASIVRLIEATPPTLHPQILAHGELAAACASGSTMTTPWTRTVEAAPRQSPAAAPRRACSAAAPGRCWSS